MKFYTKLILIQLVIGLIECKIKQKNVNINKMETASEVMENRNTWSYNMSVPIGQPYWSLTYPACGGANQSPININVLSTIENTFNNDCKLQISGYSVKAYAFNITNDGHTVTLDFNYGNKTVPSIFSGPLKQDTYEFYQIHFHWGKNKRFGSEHSFNNKKFLMEVHLIHFNKKYNSFNEAASKFDGLVVIGLFYELNNIAPVYDFIEYFRYIKTPGTKLHITTLHNKPLYSINDIIGKINFNEYYLYKGSLTSPPCYESVTWLLGVKTIQIQLKQYLQFQNLVNSDGFPMVNNYRQSQYNNERQVFYNILK